MKIVTVFLLLFLCAEGCEFIFQVVSFFSLSSSFEDVERENDFLLFSILKEGEREREGCEGILSESCLFDKCAPRSFLCKKKKEEEGKIEKSQNGKLRIFFLVC